MNTRKDEHLAATHVFCVYFGDATYEWREAEDCVDFDCELAEHLRAQPILASRPKFIKAVDEADAWFGSQLNAKDTPHTRAARAAREPGEPRAELREDTEQRELAEAVSHDDNRAERAEPERVAEDVPVVDVAEPAGWHAEEPQGLPLRSRRQDVTDVTEVTEVTGVTDG